MCQNGKCPVHILSFPINPCLLLGQLYDNSESLKSLRGQSSKRQKLENPIDTVLTSIASATNANVRNYHFQTLLFFIDRHWAIVHAALRQQVIRVLTQCLSYNDPAIQSWSFICLAAIAHAEGRSASNDGAPDTNWDTVWTLAMRRANVPAVCRAACHAAHVLLHHAKTLLTPTRVLVEIETFAKDLDVQGSPLPYDSVCAFLTLCIRVANQDVTLYRMHLEDKVLTWLVDSWRPSGAVRKMPLHSVQDLMMLLGSACSLAQQGDLICEMMLPDCPIVAAAKEDRASAVIREFVLLAKLPPFHTSEQSPNASRSIAPLAAQQTDSRDLIQPHGRERRVSAFFLKALEEVVDTWDAQKEVHSLPTSERVRSTLDLSVLAISFEGLLHVNGVQPNRRVMQAACRLIQRMLPIIQDTRWDLDERALLVQGFCPLYIADRQQGDHEPWETLLPPGHISGIRTGVLKTLVPGTVSFQMRAQAARRKLQSAIFSSSDVSSRAIRVGTNLRRVIGSRHVSGCSADAATSHGNVCRTDC